MNALWDGILEGLRLLVRGDPALWAIIAVSARVSGAALLISAALGIPLGAFLGLRRFPGRRLIQAVVYTGMGLPPVVVGLGVYLLLSRGGPLGQVTWLPRLFTVPAMVLAQVIIALPMIVGYVMSAVAEVGAELRLQLRALGASPVQATAAVLREARQGVVVALVGGLGSIISEVGAVMLVGGNIEGSTRVLTTAILLETRRGSYALAIGLGLVLLLIAFVLNLGMTRLQGSDR